MKRICLSVLFLFSSAAWALPYRDLVSYSEGIAVSISKGARFELQSVEPTMKVPVYTYKVIFATDSAELMSLKDAATNPSSFATNTGKRLAWEAKYCTAELKRIMLRHGLDMVAAEITDMKMQTQMIAVCFAE